MERTTEALQASMSVAVKTIARWDQLSPGDLCLISPNRYHGQPPKTDDDAYIYIGCVESDYPTVDIEHVFLSHENRKLWWPIAKGPGALKGPRDNSVRLIQSIDDCEEDDLT